LFSFFLLVLSYMFLFAVLCALWRWRSVKMQNPLIFTMQGENITFFLHSQLQASKALRFLAIFQTRVYSRIDVLLYLC
jgi:hypothetical protein